jgi:hypothetical protein
MLGMGAGAPQAITIDAEDRLLGESNDGTIESVPLAGGTVKVLAPGYAQPANVAVDGDYACGTNFVPRL